MTSVRVALPFLDASDDSALRGRQLDDYFEFLHDPDWPSLSERVIDQIVGTHWLERLGDLMPGLPIRPGAVLPTHMLSQRVQNVLARNEIRNWIDLADLSVAELSDLRNAGPQTLNEILELALKFAAGPPPGYGEPEELLTDTETSRHDSVPHVVAVAGLRPLATWAARERSLGSISDLLTVAAGLNTPEDLVTSWGQLQINVADLADPGLVKLTISEVFDELLTHLSDSRRLVLEQRLLAERPKTFEELGRVRGVTGQAMGRHETKLKRELDDLLAREEFAPLRWRAWDLGRSLGALAPAAAPSTTQALDRATRDVDERHSPPVLQLLLRLAGPYASQDGWFVREDLPGVPSAHDFWDAYDPAIVIDLQECRTWLSSQDADPSHFEKWVETANAGRVEDGKLLRWSGSAQDKAIALLTLFGEPATPEELTERIGEEHDARRLRDKLLVDPRVVRVDRYRFALREWNMDEYSGIAEEIAQRIREHGGVAPLDKVVRDLVETFGVAENSVRASAEAPMFAREGNSVRLRGDHETFGTAGGLSECAGAYLLPGGSVSYLVRVRADVLRGNGRRCPKALAQALGVAPGRELTFSSETGALRVTWPRAVPGPALGSTRSFAVALGLSLGDDLRLTFHLAERAVTATGSTADEMANAIPSAALEQLTGLQTAGEDPRHVLGVAMGVTADTVDRVLRDRGDGRVAALLPQQRSDEDLDSALEGLAELLGFLE